MWAPPIDVYKHMDLLSLVLIWLITKAHTSDAKQLQAMPCMAIEAAATHGTAHVA